MKSVMHATAIGLTLTAPAAATSDERTLERGRAASELLLTGDGEALAARMAPAFLADIGGAAGTEAFLDAIAAQAGAEQTVLEEHTFRENGYASYYRRSRFERMPDVTTLWVFSAEGTIMAGSVRPTAAPAPSAHLEYVTKTRLHLPFGAAPEGEWYVGWGGRDLIHNYHAAVPDQRFAYDLYVANDGRPFRTDGRANEDHYCFGEPIRAPGAGVVAKAVDSLPDNPPGTMDPEHAVGNHLVIDHGNGEFSFLAHLQKGSVLLREGDAVAVGQAVGRCGNSGNSSMPHLHYHLQTTAEFARGEGLPAQFNGYRANGQRVERGEPRRGQYLVPEDN